MSFSAANCSGLNRASILRGKVFYPRHARPPLVGPPRLLRFPRPLLLGPVSFRDHHELLPLCFADAELLADARLFEHFVGRQGNHAAGRPVGALTK